MVVSIQYLRGYAAIAVAVFHLYPMFFNSSANPFSGGASGVDIFFVISGFIMWHVAQPKEPAPLDFFLHRLIRVAPPYWLATLILAVCARLKPNLFPLDIPTFGHVLLSLGFFPHGGELRGRPLITQGWTLNYEMFFYLIFAVVLLLPARHRFKTLATLFVALVVAGAILDTQSPALHLVTSDLLLEFLAGIAIAVAYRARRVAPVGLAVCSVILGTAILAINPQLHLPRSVALGLPAAVIVYSMVSLEKHGLFARNRVLLALGNVSFALYLVHFLAASMYRIAAPHIGLPIHGPLAYLLGLSCALCSAFAFHLYAEEPMRKFLQTKLKQIREPITLAA